MNLIPHTRTHSVLERLDRNLSPFVEVHFMDVGQGNMTVIIFPNNTVMVYDCNITKENSWRVINYLSSILPQNHQWIDFFINSHRDLDHLCGIGVLDRSFPIMRLIDSGVSGTNSKHYRKYMEIRRRVGQEVLAGNHWVMNNDPNVYAYVLNGNTQGETDTNRQSLVLKISYYGSSVLLPGDTDSKIWRDSIVPQFGDLLKSNILLASHHGSYSFFEYNDDYYYRGHMDLINPQMTVISVGEDNPHNHPNDKALALYEKHSTGDETFGHKVFRTDEHKDIALELRGHGAWFMETHQIPYGVLESRSS